jgi:spore coat polysaccharide biosynthesis protein SpsF
MRAGVIIQARHSSARLPGKVLQPLAGRPILGWLIERLRTEMEAPIIVATSDQPEDTAVAELAATCGVATYRGPLEDVLARMVAAAEAFGLDAAVRVSGDSPLLDPRLVSRALQLFGEGNWDLVTNVQQRTFPKGQSVEVIAAAALRRANAEAQDPGDREHVTPFFYARPARFRIRNFGLDPSAADVRLCVDTPEDLAVVESVVRAMARPHAEYGVEELVTLYRDVTATP